MLGELAWIEKPLTWIAGGVGNRAKIGGRNEMGTVRDIDGLAERGGAKKRTVVGWAGRRKRGKIHRWQG